MPGTNMIVRLWASIGLLAAGLAVACSVSSPTENNWSDPSKINFYSGLHVNLARMTRTNAGTFYWDSIHGSGTVPLNAGDQVSVGYSLWLPDGTLLESRQSGVSLTVDSTHVIKGWVDGLQGAVQGTVRQLVVPPALGYPYGNGSTIPANTTLVFLVSIDRITSASASVAAATSPKR